MSTQLNNNDKLFEQMYNIEYTNKFGKMYKLALKRGFNKVLIQEVITTMLKIYRFHLSIKYTNYLDNTKIAGNATYNQIGYLFGRLMKKLIH